MVIVGVSIGFMACTHGGVATRPTLADKYGVDHSANTKILEKSENNHNPNIFFFLFFPQFEK